MIYVCIIKNQLKIGLSESFWKMFTLNLLQYLKSLTTFFFFIINSITNSYSNNMNYLITKLRNIYITFKASIYLFTTSWLHFQIFCYK